MIRINKQKSKPEPEPNPSLSKTSRATPSSDLIIQQHPKKTLAKQKLWFQTPQNKFYNSSLFSSFCICWWQLHSCRLRQNFVLNWTNWVFQVFVLAIETSLLQNGRMGCSYLCLQIETSSLQRWTTVLSSCLCLQDWHKFAALFDNWVLMGAAKWLSNTQQERETCTHTATHTYMWSGRLEGQEMNVAVFPMHAWDARGGSAFLNPKPICVKPRFKWEICLGFF